MSNESSLEGWKQFSDVHPDIYRFPDLVDTTSNLTYSLTILKALQKLNFPNKSKINIHILGAHQKTESQNSVFKKLGIILSRYYKTLSTVNLLLIGDELQFDKEYQISEKSITINVLQFKGLYHELFKSKLFSVPDIVFAFNAGIWVYETWGETCKLFEKEIQAPFIVTAYSKKEADWDEKLLFEDAPKLKSIWKVEKNPFGSLSQTEGVTKFESHANSWWQCVGTCSSNDKINKTKI